MANNADAIDLMNEVERLRAQVDTLTDVIERIGTTAEARIEAALGQLSVMRCECKPPKGPMCDRHLLERTLKGEA